MNAVERAKQLADEGAMIHCCDWMEIQSVLRSLVAEIERLETTNSAVLLDEYRTRITSMIAKLDGHTDKAVELKGASVGN